MTGDVLPKGFHSMQTQLFTPEQMNLFKNMFGQIGPESFTARLARGAPGIFDEIEAPAKRQFQEMQGDIASRFSGSQPGMMSARRGSGFQGEMNQATRDLAMDLQAQRMGLMRGAEEDLMKYQEMLLGQTPFHRDIYQQQKKPSFLKRIFGGALPAIGAGIGGIFGGLPGAKMGGFLGSGLRKGFLG